MKTLVDEILSSDGNWKVRIFRRRDGSFGVESLRWSEEPLEMC